MIILRRQTGAGLGWAGAEGPPEGRLDDEGGGCEAPAASALQLRQLAGPQEHPRLANLRSADAG